MASDWFKTWFNTDYYHILYKNRNNTEARQFIDALLAYLQPSRSSHFLDVACGKGRHSIYLNSLGYEVTGIDLSENSINTALASANERLHFKVQDIREDFGIHAIDIALNMFTSFGYFDSDEEHVKALENIKHSLKEKGLLVFDYLNVDYVAKHLINEEIQQRDHLTFKINRSIKNDFIVKSINLEDKGETHHFEERVKAFRYDRLASMFDKAGFSISQTFGDYQLNPLSEDRPRVILIAEKKA